MSPSALPVSLCPRQHCRSAYVPASTAGQFMSLSALPVSLCPCQHCRSAYVPVMSLSALPVSRCLCQHCRSAYVPVMSLSALPVSRRHCQHCRSIYARSNSRGTADSQSITTVSTVSRLSGQSTGHAIEWLRFPMLTHAKMKPYHPHPSPPPPTTTPPRTAPLARVVGSVWGGGRSDLQRSSVLYYRYMHAK